MGVCLWETFYWGAILIDTSMFNCKHHPLPIGSRRSGYTLVEILMATALALLLLVSVIRIFMMMSDGFAESRVLLEMLGRIRNAQRMLESDLSHYTVTMRPPRPVEADDGYFACGKKDGWGGTSLSAEVTNFDPNLKGDCDRFVALTVFNKEIPFRYWKSSKTYETPYAEVVWYVKENNLYRAMRPIRLSEEDESGATDGVHYTSLGKLGEPEKRLAKNGLDSWSTMVLPNVIYFEVELWDPRKNQYVAPWDEVGGQDIAPTPYENGISPEKDYFAWRDNPPQTYDTWSTLMLVSSQSGGEGELTSTSTTGDESVVIVTGIFADNTESETSESEKFPPSTAFLPGVRIVVRAFDPSSGQVREFRVAQDFRTR